MVMTTWDGHLRIDHVADAGTVSLTLVTVEPATELRLHAGLVAGFVTADPHGPPASVVVALRDGALPEDVAVLLGARVSAVVAELLAAGGSGRWLQLDLVEVDDLAAAWAPYRVAALEAGPRTAESTGVLGAWAGELWTCLGLHGWRDRLRPPDGAVAAGGTFRGADDEPLPEAVRDVWRLPDELAAAVAVEPDVECSVRRTTGDEVRIDLAVRSSGRPARAVLQAGVDDGSGGWVTFEADGSGGLRASLVGSDESVSVLFRSASRGT